MSTIKELTKAISPDELRTQILDAMSAAGLPVTTWKQGAVVRTIAACVGVVGAAMSALQEGLARSAFLGEAEADWLSIVAEHVYGVTRLGGSFATGSVTLANSGGGLFSVAAGDLIVRNPTTGAQYRSTAAFTLAPLGTATVTVQAIEIGTDSSSAGGTLTEIVAPAMTGVTASNAAALVASDPETDAELRARCRAKLGSLSPNGAADAYRYVATSATRADGSSIGVTRVTTVPDGLGGVDVYLATASGTVPGTAGDTGTDLGAVADAIWRQCEPLAVDARVQSATAANVSIVYALWVRGAGISDGELEALVSDALAEHLAAVPIGGDVIDTWRGVDRSSLEAAIADAVPGTVVRLDVTTPVADVPLVVPQAPVLGTVTATITQLGGL